MTLKDLEPIREATQFKTGTKQVEIARRGGKAGNRLRKSISHRKSCSPTCPIYATCWAKHAAEARQRQEQLTEDKLAVSENRTAVKIKPRCALKEMPGKLQYYVSVISSGQEQDLNNILTERVLEHLGKTELRNDVKMDIQLTRLMMDLKSKIFGDKTRLEQEANTVFVVEFSPKTEKKSPNNEPDARANNQKAQD